MEMLNVLRRISDPRKDRRLKGIIHGGISALASRGTGLLVSVISLPLTVRYLGPERYGIWVTVSTTVVMLGVMDLGIANSLTNIISKAYINDDQEHAQRFYSTAFWVSVALSSIIGVIALLIWPHVSWGSMFNLSNPPAAHEAALCVAIAVGYFLLSLPLNLIHRALSGYQQTQISNYFGLVSGLAGLLVILLVIHFHGSLLALMFCYSGTFLLGTLILHLWIYFGGKRWILPTPRVISRTAARELLNSGAGFFILQLAGIIVFNSDNLVITHFLGPAEVAAYSVTWRLAGYASILQSAVFPSLWPAYSEAYARGDYTWVRKTFWNTVRIAMGTAGAAILVMTFFGRQLIRWYVGASAVPTQALLIAICCWTFISAGMDLEACLLAAVNRVKWQSILSVVAAVVNIALSVALVKRIGSLGVVLGTMISYLLVLVGPQTVIVWRVLYRTPVQQKALAVSS